MLPSVLIFDVGLGLPLSLWEGALDVLGWGIGFGLPSLWEGAPLLGGQHCKPSLCLAPENRSIAGLPVITFAILKARMVLGGRKAPSAGEATIIEVCPFSRLPSI